MIRLSNWRYFIRRYPQVLAVPFLIVIGFIMISAVMGPTEPITTNTRMAKYSQQQTYARYSNTSSIYTFAVIADKDKDSKNSQDKVWESELKKGVLKRLEDGDKVSYVVDWETTYPIKSKISESDRGMELSDLTFWNNMLLSFDDRTGIVYEIDYEEKLGIARHILVDGNGKTTSKGFKCEWSTVKDGVLHIGSLGKEWTSNGKILSQDPQWIKTIDLNGQISHVSWVHVYQGLRRHLGYLEPGYLIHEAVRFNQVNRRWYFLPRRASREEYDDVQDEKRGANLMITTDENFEDIQKKEIGPQIPEHGFSAFAFVPHREDEIVALKSAEVEGDISTYITVFNSVTGEILLKETLIGTIKYEGVEFL